MAEGANVPRVLEHNYNALLKLFWGDQRAMRILNYVLILISPNFFAYISQLLWGGLSLSRGQKPSLFVELFWIFR